MDSEGKHSDQSCSSTTYTHPEIKEYRYSFEKNLENIIDKHVDLSDEDNNSEMILVQRRKKKSKSSNNSTPSKHDVCYY